MSRNQREGQYAGKWRGTHRRTKCVQQMLWVSAARYQRFLLAVNARAAELHKLLNE